jgi:hypothetical protein
MTANEAEMGVLKMALSRINTKCELNIYTENTYIANAVKNGWASRWKENGWKTKTGKDVANRKLWEELLPLMEGNTIRWHVKEPHAYRNWLRDEVENNRQFVAPVQPVIKEENDESYLFFLRHSKDPEMPWYTLEVEPSGNIRQKRTTGDNQKPDFQDAVGFLKEWQQYFKKQLTPAEKELGKISDEKRKANYKKLREEGKTVWHGKLAGQLLAEVLEKDFMEAM